MMMIMMTVSPAGGGGSTWTRNGLKAGMVADPVFHVEQLVASWGGIHSFMRDEMAFHLYKPPTNVVTVAERRCGLSSPFDG
jgi:hypothetical protein